MILLLSSFFYFHLLLLLSGNGIDRTLFSHAETDLNNNNHHVISSSPIQSITILANTAQILREFHTPALSSGYHTLLVENLPSKLLDQSIHVKSLSHVTIISTAVRSQEVRRDNDELYRQYLHILQILQSKYEKAIEKLLVEKSRIEMRVETLDKYLNFIFTHQELKVQDIPLASVIEIIDKKDDEIVKRNTQLEQINSQLLVMRERTDNLKSTSQTLLQTGYFIPFPCEEYKEKLGGDGDLEDIQCSTFSEFIKFWPETMTKKDLSLQIHVAADQTKLSEHPYSITYLTETGAATWSPQYDIRYEGEINSEDFTYSLKIDLYAHIDQNTGEDWDNAQLTLSTAYPTQLIHPPTNKQLTVGFRPIGLESMSTGIRMKTASTRMYMEAAAPNLARMEADIESVAVASVSSAGDMGVSYLFKPTHKSSILTREHKKAHTLVKVQKPGYSLSSIPTTTSGISSDRIFVNTLTASSRIFSYAIPSSASGVFLRSWGVLPSGDENSAPLLPSNGARIFLQGQYLGTLDIQSTQPGGKFKFELGKDKNIEVESNIIPPTHSNKEEEKTLGWFTIEKKKYRVKTDDVGISLRSTYSRSQLVILSEFLPHSTEPDIIVELVDPVEASLNLVVDMTAESDMIDYVVNHALLATENPKVQTHIFHCKKTHQIVWAIWIQPQQTIRLRYSYRILWPDGQEISIY